MKFATTRQFRAAVTTALTALGMNKPTQSWTEGAGRGSDIRYVGYPVFAMSKADKDLIVLAVERLLAVDGVTAMTRFTNRRNRTYLRGTGWIA